MENTNDTNRNEAKEARSRLLTSLLLLLIAVVSVTAVSVAWFSIADNTRVSSMLMDVTTGYNLRFDLDPHDTLEEYVRVLAFEDIEARILQEKGFDMASTPLDPVTTSDASVFTYEDGTVSSAGSGSYLEFTLNFMSAEDMDVHLTNMTSDGEAIDIIAADDEALINAMRISFTVDGETFIYDPNMGDEASKSDNVTYFGLPASANMEYNENNILFHLDKGVNKPVLVHIWLEGTDPGCDNDIQNFDYQISMKFEGTDADGNVFFKQ